MPSRSPFARSNPAAVALMALLLTLGALTSQAPAPADPAADTEGALDSAVHDRAELDLAADGPIAGVRLAAGETDAATDAASADDATADVGHAGDDDPHPVQYLEVHVGGEPVAFAFRDVAPRLVNGRTAVLLRDGAGEAWAPTVQALSEAGFRVIVPDLGGHGRSGPPAESLGSDALADHVAILLDSLGAASAALVGEGAASQVAVRLATRWPRTQRLVVAAAGADGGLPTAEALAELTAGLAGVPVPTLIVAEGGSDAGPARALRETAAGAPVRIVAVPGRRGAGRAAPGGFHEVMLGFLAR